MEKMHCDVCDAVIALEEKVVPNVPHKCHGIAGARHVEFAVAIHGGSDICWTCLLGAMNNGSRIP